MNVHSLFRQKRSPREKIKAMLDLPFLKMQVPRKLTVTCPMRTLDICMDGVIYADEPVDQVIAAVLTLKQQVDRDFAHSLAELKKIKES